MTKRGRFNRRVAGVRRGVRGSVRVDAAGTSTSLGVAVVTAVSATHRLLTIDGTEQSYVDLSDPTYLHFPYLREMARIVDLLRPPPAPLYVVHVGGGGCALPRYFAATRPRSRQRVFESVDAVLRLSRGELGLRTSPRLRARLGDGRSRLSGLAPGSADVVVGDAFDGPLPPRHLASVEYHERLRTVLRRDGLYVLNVIDGPPFLLSGIMTQTVSAVFPHVVVSAPAAVLDHQAAGNVVVLASPAPLDAGRLTPAASEEAGCNRIVQGPALEDLAAGMPLVRDEDESWLVVFRRAMSARPLG